MNNASSSIFGAFHAGSTGLRLRGGAAAVTLAMLCLAAATVIFRRLAGALAEPLPSATLVVTGMLIAIVAAAVRIGLDRAKQRRNLTVMGITTLAAIGLYAALCLPGTSPATVALAALALAAEESWFWFRVIRQPRNPKPAAAPVAPRENIVVEDKSDTDESFGFEATPDERVTQQIVRARTAEGGEIVTGRLRATFPAGQRTGSVHLAFCPPLDSTPEVEIEQIGGPEARIKTAQVLPYGVRFDVKLASASDEPADILVQLSAVTP